eukprot:15365128-Ditylum_brightwellii.AAC.1
MALVVHVLSSKTIEGSPIAHPMEELKLQMSLILMTPLSRGNNSVLVVAPVGSPCLEMSQCVATPSASVNSGHKEVICEDSTECFVVVVGPAENSAINLEKFLEKSGVDSFVEFIVGTKDRIFVVGDNIMAPECSFQRLRGRKIK